MAQNRLFNWQDDDSTYNINKQNLMAIPRGLYRGFYKKETGAGDMTLVLEHDTNLPSVAFKNPLKLVNEDLTETPFLGIWKTTQGVVVIEDANITLNVDDGGADFRYDLIVGKHQYQQTVGGTSATYTVIKGTEGSNNLPALTFPTKQVILGILKVPAGVTDIDECTFERVVAKFNDVEIPELFENNEFHKKNWIRTLVLSRANATIDNATKTLNVNFNYLSNYVIVNDTGKHIVKNIEFTAPADIDIVTENGDFEKAGIVMITTMADIELQSGGNITIEKNEKVFIQKGSTFWLVRIVGFTSEFWFYAGSTTDLLGNTNKFDKTQIWSKAENQATINGDDEVVLPDETSDTGGNFIELDNSGGGTIEAIFSLYSKTNRYKNAFDNYTSADEMAGGFIFLKLLHDTEVTNLGSGTSAHAKPVKILTGDDMTYPAGTILLLLENDDEWLLLSAFNDQLQKQIENMLLEMNTLFVEKTTVIDDASNVNLTVIGSSGGTDLKGWNINKGMGNNILMTFSGSVAGDIVALPENYAIGTKIRIRFDGAVIPFHFNDYNNMNISVAGWLPISSFSRRGTFTPRANTTYVFLRLTDRWVLYNDEGLIPTWYTMEEDLIKSYLAGEVGSDGSRLSYWGDYRIGGAYPFSSTKVSTGEYRITHDLGTDNYAVLLTRLRDGGVNQPCLLGVQDKGTNDFKVIITTYDNVPIDANFSFLVFKVH